MSSEWVNTTLGEICLQQGGAIQTGPFGSQLHTSDYKETGVPVVMPTNIGDGGIVEDGIARISAEDVQRLSQHILRIGDIIFSRRGDVTKNALIREREIGWFCGTGCLKVRLGNESIATAKFISHCLRLPDIKEWLIRHAVGATMPNLNTGILSAVPIFLPPLKTQNEIAEILDSLDDRIALLRETNTTLESIAQALFKSWFVDFDPVHANAGTQEPSLPPEIQNLFPSTFVESPLGLVPEGWGVGKVGDLANVKGGFAFKGDTFCDSGVPVIKIKNIVGDGTVDIDGVQYVNIEQGEKSKKFLLNDGDILMAMTGATIGKTGIVVTDSKAPLLNQRVAKFEPKSQDLSNGWLIYTAFQNNFMADQILNAASGSAQANISTAGIESAKLILPENPSILRAFEDIASTVFSGWVENHKKAKTLSILRDTLLPRLISGQLRLPEVEERAHPSPLPKGERARTC